MNPNSINIIGRNQASREDALLFLINDVEGLVDSLDKDISEWSDFDLWKNLRAQNWIFERAMDVYHGKKIDIQCECCNAIYFEKNQLQNISNQKCYGRKSEYMIAKVLEEIELAKERRESDGTYSV